MLPTLSFSLADVQGEGTYCTLQCIGYVDDLLNSPVPVWKCWGIHSVVLACVALVVKHNAGQPQAFSWKAHPIWQLWWRSVREGVTNLKSGQANLSEMASLAWILGSLATKKKTQSGRTEFADARSKCASHLQIRKRRREFCEIAINIGRYYTFIDKVAAG